MAKREMMGTSNSLGADALSNFAFQASGGAIVEIGGAATVSGITKLASIASGAQMMISGPGPAAGVSATVEVQSNGAYFRAAQAAGTWPSSTSCCPTCRCN